MVNVNGGFAYIDMSSYGEFEVGTEKEVIFVGDDARKIRGGDKPLVICNLTYKDGLNDAELMTPFIPAANRFEYEDSEEVKYDAMAFCFIQPGTGDSIYVFLKVGKNSNAGTIEISTF